MDLPDKEIAKQLAMWAASKFYCLSNPEIYYFLIKKIRSSKETPNFLSLFNHESVLVNFTLHTILSQNSFEKATTVLKRFFNIAEILTELNCFCESVPITSVIYLPTLHPILNGNASFLNEKDDMLQQNNKIAVMKKAKIEEFFKTVRNNCCLLPINVISRFISFIDESGSFF
jgi:hypothetical protein